MHAVRAVSARRSRRRKKHTNSQAACKGGVFCCVVCLTEYSRALHFRHFPPRVSTELIFRFFKAWHWACCSCTSAGSCTLTSRSNTSRSASSHIPTFSAFLTAHPSKSPTHHVTHFIFADFPYRRAPQPHKLASETSQPETRSRLQPSSQPERYFAARPVDVCRGHRQVRVHP